MLKISNLCYIAAAISLISTSCSTTRASRKAAKIEAENAIAISEEGLQEEQEVTTEVVRYTPSEAESSQQDIAQEVEAVEEADDVQPFEVFSFDEDQTSSVVLREYKNMIVDDIELNLKEENSCYPADGYRTSPYGWRRGRMHAGVDIKAYKGDNIYAAFDGVVRLAKYYGSYGNCIVIRHYNGLETVYGHSSKLLVKVNDQVKAGDVIAYAGSTGRSTGSHLHFETRVGGQYFSPEFILDTKNRRIKDTTLYITMRNGRLFASNNSSKEERDAKILQELSIRYHTVRSGDNLSTIAANNGTTVSTICRLNGISSRSILRIGQRLVVRDGIKPAATSTASAATKTAASTASSSKSSISTVKYTIKSGDTLGKIAINNGTTITAICNLNNISRNTTLRIGRKLNIPTSQHSSSRSSNATAVTYYRVKSGDTLGRIAALYGTSINTLCRLNGISRTSILSINQRLRVR